MAVGIYVFLTLVDIILLIPIYKKFLGDKSQKEFYDTVYNNYVNFSEYELYRECNVLKNDLDNINILKYIGSAFGGVVLSRLTTNEVFLDINKEFIGATDFTLMIYIVLLCLLIVEIVIIITYENGLRVEILRMLIEQRKLSCG